MRRGRRILLMFDVDVDDDDAADDVDADVDLWSLLYMPL